MQQRTSRLHLRFPAWTNLHFKPVPPFNQLLCMPSQPLLDFSSKISDWATQSYLWLYSSPWGNFIKLLCILRRKARWLANYSIGGPDSFPHAARNHALIRQERQLHTPLQLEKPPIGPPLLPHQSGSCLLVLYMVIPPPASITLNVWAAKQISSSLERKGTKSLVLLTRLIVWLIVHFGVR